MTYLVIENAGYEGERIVHRHKSFRAAYAWVRDRYNTDQLEEMHVDIALERADGSITFDH